MLTKRGPVGFGADAFGLADDEGAGAEYVLLASR